MVASKTDNPNKGFPGSSKGPDVTEKKSVLKKVSEMIKWKHLVPWWNPFTMENWVIIE